MNEESTSSPAAGRRLPSLSVDAGIASIAEHKLRHDSDSDEEVVRTNRHHRRHSSLLKAGMGLLGHLGSLSRDEDDDSYSPDPDDFAATPKDDDSVVSDDCMILTDDEEDSSETEVLPKKNDDEDILGVASPGSSSSSTLEAAKIKSMFAEKHPWRRQSRRESSATRMLRGQKLPSTSTGMMEDESGEPLLKPTHRDKRTGLFLGRSMDEEDDSSSASEDDTLSMQSSLSVMSDPEEDFDFDALDKIPSHFTSQPQVMLSYFDPSLHTISKRDSNVFAYEHSLLLRAVMQLLAERDYIGVEADLDDPSCVVKKGPLKKATHAVGRTTWRVKYVEIRSGSFSYFEDSPKSEKLGRKTIPLRSTKCICESVKGNQFALEVEGGPRRLWMTNSEEERQAWVRAIQAAMIGAGAGDSSHPLDETQYQAALDQFQETQSNLAQARSPDVYKSFIDEVLQTNIRIPVKWVREQATGVYGSSRHMLLGSSAQKHMVTGFWKSLKGETVSINGHEVSSNSPHAPERVVGALSRCILEFDKSSPLAAVVPMTELQAISYARDVIMAVLRSRNKEESYLALDYLCQNPSLVSVEQVVTSEPHETISVQVNYARPVASENPQRDISGWVGTRQRVGRNWRNRFIIVSDGILNVFEHNSPRPHGLKGQLLLAGASASFVEDGPKSEASLFILRVVSRNQESEYHLSFPDENLQQEWQHVIQKAIDSWPVPAEGDPASNASCRKPMFLAATPGGKQIIKSASEGSAKLIRGATGQFMKATDMMIRSMRSSTGPHSRTSSTEMYYSTVLESEPSLSLGVASSMESEHVFNLEPTVQIMAETVSMCRIIACEPSGIDEDDVWAYVLLSLFTQKSCYVVT
jgi:hypothetical protein